MADKNDPDVPPIPLPPESAATPITAPEPAPVPPVSPYATAPQAPVPPAPYGQAGYQQPAGYGQQPTAYGQQPYGAYQTPTPPQGISIAALITGIAGLIGVPFASIAGVVLGHIGQKKQPWAKGFWLTGLITGYVGVAFWALIIIAYVGFFAWAISTDGNFS